MFQSIHRQRDAERSELLLDRRGHPRPAVTLPGHKAGERPPNYGQTFPAEVLTAEEIGRLIAACPRRGPGIGAPMSASYWRAAIKRLGEKAGIEKRVHSHGLRHTHAVELSRERLPILYISRQLGHSNLAITQRYVDHLEPGEVIAAMQAREWPLHERMS